MIYIGRVKINEIKYESVNAYPNECCGILLGEIDVNENKRLRFIEPIVNSQAKNEQYHRFLITPEDIMKAELQARKLKLDVLGFYHSHPDCPAKPSDYDREHALPFYSYLIVSVIKGEAKEVKSWKLSNDRSDFSEEEIINNEPYEQNESGI